MQLGRGWFEKSGPCRPLEGIQKVTFQVKETKASNVHANTSICRIAEAVKIPIQLSKTSCRDPTMLSIQASTCTEVVSK